jgi:hypothetical protein
MARRHEAGSMLRLRYATGNVYRMVERRDLGFQDLAAMQERVELHFHQEMIGPSPREGLEEVRRTALLNIPGPKAYHLGWTT